jgi:hypothetical protein
VLLESLKHESRFRAVVAESAYFDFPSIARERVARMLPLGFQWIAPPLVVSGIVWGRWHDGVDLDQASAADGVRYTTVPVLLIHGLDDPKPHPATPGDWQRSIPQLSFGWFRAPGTPTRGKPRPREFESQVTGWFSTH